MIAGVHSTVWIFAISAATTSRALSKSSSSPSRDAGVQVVADRVVLAHEERVQEREADPEVAGHTREVDVRLELLGDQSALVEPELAELARADRLANAGSRP